MRLRLDVARKMGAAEVLQYLRTPEGLISVKRVLGLIGGVLVIINSVIAMNALLGINPYVVIRSVWYILFGVFMVAAEWPTEHPTLGKCAPDGQGRMTKLCALQTSAFARSSFFLFVGTTVPQPNNTLSWVAGGFSVVVAVAELLLAGKRPQRKAAGPDPAKAWPPNKPADGLADTGAADTNDQNDTPAWAKGAKANDMVAIPPPSGGAAVKSSTAGADKPTPPPNDTPAASTWPPPGGDDAGTPAVWPPPNAEDGV